MPGPRWLVGVVMLVACGGGPNKDSVFECDVSTAPSPTPMRRLSHDQYRQTVHHAIERLGGSVLRERVGERVDALIDRIPDDFADETLSREDQVISQTHAEQWYLVAETVADGVRTLDPLPCDDPLCVPEFIETQGSRLLRHPLNDEERTFFGSIYDAVPDHADGIRDLVLVWLSHPMFVMQVEHGASEDGSDTTALTGPELASRLSYHAWNAPPDDALWTKALDGSLLDEAVYVAEVERLFDDGRSRGPRERFFRDWLQLDTVPRLDLQVGQPRFDAFRGDVTPTAELSELVRDDTLNLLEWHIRNRSPLDDVFTAAVHTVTEPEVGALYGTNQLWDGHSDPETLTTGHGGLLTRPAFHVAGTASTRPIRKGVLIRRRILCDSLGDPPADLGPEPEIDPAATQRQRTEQLTEIEGSICAGCHTFVNPLGYATERFDGLGRARTQETVWGLEGERLATSPVDDEGMLRIEATDETVTAGHEALAEALADSAKTDACLARFWFRHTWGRHEDEAVDGCVLQGVEQRLQQGESLDEALRAIALDPTFRQRRFDEGETP
ncbi:MAG: DUF1588 domain-containing protein [Myxococcota bacterium]